MYTSDLHPVAAKRRSLVRVTEGVQQATVKTIVRADTLVVVGGALQYIAINTLRKRRKMGLSETCLRLIRTVEIAKIHIGKAAWNALGEMATGRVAWAQTLVGEGHVDKLIVATEGTIFCSLNLALQLVLNALAVRSIADEREDGTNALDKQSSLRRFSIVQSSLIPHINTRNIQKENDAPEHSSCRTSHATTFLVDYGSEARQSKFFEYHAQRHECTAITCQFGSSRVEGIQTNLLNNIRAELLN